MCTLSWPGLKMKKKNDLTNMTILTWIIHQAGQLGYHVQFLGELLSVVDQELGAGLNQLAAEVVDLPKVLERHQVLLGEAAGAVDVAEPVALVLVLPVDAVDDPPLDTDLRIKNYKVCCFCLFQFSLYRVALLVLLLLFKGPC